MAAAPGQRRRRPRQVRGVLEPRAGWPAEWEVPGWGAAGLVVRASLRAHAAARNVVRLHYSSHHDPGAALAHFGLARGSGTWAPALGGGEKWDLGTEVESDKADQDLAFFLEAAACCPVLYRARYGAERRWLAAVARSVWLSLQRGVFGVPNVQRFWTGFCVTRLGLFVLGPG